jgi:hypothetical protein
MDAIYPDHNVDLISKYVLATVNDPETVSLLKFTLGLSKKHLKIIEFKSEKLELPQGFTEEDVNLNAPPLFTAKFWLIYIHEYDNARPSWIYYFF